MPRFDSSLRLLALCAAVLAAPLLVPPPASAQDDWGVDGGAERREEIIRRYLGILDARPERGPIFDRLLTEVGGGARFERLVEQYAARSEDDPTSFSAAMLHGHLLAHAERWEAALAAYGRAIEADDADPRGYRASGDVLRQLDRREEAELAYEAALERAPDRDATREVLQALADLAFEAREWERASTYTARIIEIDPTDVFVRMELAETLVRYERFDEALAQYEAVEGLAGRDTRQRAMAMKDQGDVLALMGQGEAALQRYRSAMALVDEGYWLQRELEQRVIAVYREEDRLAELVAEFEAQWRRPTTRRWMLLASLYDELGRDADALNAYRSAVRQDRGAIDARLALVRLLERQGDLDAVIAELETLIRQQPQDASFQFRLIDLYRRTGERAEALERLDALAVRFASQPYVLLDVADRYLRFDERDRAREMYERLVRVDPSDPDNYIALGEFHFMDGRRSEAERTWQRILEVIDDRATAHATLGQVFMDHSLFEEAINQFEEAREADPENDRYLRELAHLYRRTAVLPVALRHWQELYERTDQAQLRTEARGEIVELLDELGRLRDRIEEDRARWDAADEREAEVGYFLGAAYLHQGNEGAAEAIYRDVLEADDADLTALLALESILSRQNRIAEAIDVLVRIAEVSPGRARDTYHRLAELSLRNYDDEEAIRFASLAVELNPDDASAHARLGDIYRRMQDLDAAVLAYRQALLVDERAFPYYFELAEVYLALDRPRDAEEMYRYVVEEADDSALVLRAGRRAIVLRDANDDLEGLLGVFEARMYDPDRGEAHLKLLVESYARLTAPLQQAAAFGVGPEQEAAQVDLERIRRRALRPLLDALSSNDLRLRETALSVLSDQADPNAALPIARLLDDPDARLRVRAAIAVARIGDPRTIPRLVEVLESGDPTLAAIALWAIGRTGDAEAQAPLVAFATDAAQPAALRALAVLGLGRVAELDDDGAATLVTALDDEDERVQLAAYWAVGSQRLEAAEERARFAAQFGAPAVAEAAVWTLARLPGADAARAELLAEAWALSPPSVSSAALRALGALDGGAESHGAEARFEAGESFLDREIPSFDVYALLDGLLHARQSLATPLGPQAQEHFDAAWRGLVASGPGAGARALALVAAGSDETVQPSRVLEGGGEVFAERWASWPEEARGDLLDAQPYLAAEDAPSVVAARESALAAESPTVRAAAVRACARAGRMTPEAWALATDDDWRVRRAVAAAWSSDAGAGLTRATPLGVVDARDWFDDPFPSVRAAAYASLGATHPEAALDAAEARWSRERGVVKLALLRAAAAWSPALQARAVLLGTRDADARVRAEARALSGAAGGS